jgi:hypothetical protein
MSEAVNRVVVWSARLSIASLLLAGITTAVMARVPQSRSWLGLAPEPAYAAGQKIDVRESLYRGARRTVIVFIQDSCAACQTAKPVFAELSKSVSALDSVQMVLVPPGNAEAEIRYAGDIGLPAAAVKPLRGGVVRVQITPTLVVVDSTGQILFAYAGIPRKGEERAFIRATLRALG